MHAFEAKERLTQTKKTTQQQNMETGAAFFFLLYL